MTSYVGDISISDNDERQFGLTFYSEVVEYVANDLIPEQVFSGEILAEWASKQEIESIFDDAQLAAWAENNGFILE